MASNIPAKPTCPRFAAIQPLGKGGVPVRELVSWLSELDIEVQQSSAEHPATLVNHYKRVAYPRIEPLHGDGFIRFQGLEGYYRPGHGPEALSLMHIMQKKTEREVGVGEADAFNRQIGALLALGLNRSVEVSAEYSYQLSDSTRTAFIPLDAAKDRILHAPILDVDDVNTKFREVASQVCGIQNPDDFAAISAAIEMHYGATTAYKINMPSAYVLVVGALETLSARFEASEPDWEKWDQAQRWDKVFESLAMTEAQIARVRAELLSDRQIRLGERFAVYVRREFKSRDWLKQWKEWTWEYDGNTGAPNGGSWSDTNMDAIVPQDESELWRAIKKSYSARSKFVHSGSDDLAIHRDLLRQAHDNDGAEALPFTVLRAALARRIRCELTTHSTPVTLPPVVGFQ